MTDRTTIPRDAVVSGGRAAIGSTVALAVAAWMEGKPWCGRSTTPPATGATAVGRRVRGRGWRPHRRRVPRQRGREHLLGGVFEAWRAWRGPVRPLPMLRDALAISALAASVDYGATPKRFTPGWELALSKRGMAVAYAGPTIGMAAGALLTQSYRLRRPRS